MILVHRTRLRGKAACLVHQIQLYVVERLVPLIVCPPELDLIRVEGPLRFFRGAAAPARLTDLSATVQSKLSHDDEMGRRIGRLPAERKFRNEVGGDGCSRPAMYPVSTDS